MKTIDGALVFAACGKQAFLALENHGEIRGQGVTLCAFSGGTHTEHHSESAPIRAFGACETDAYAAAVRARAAFAFDFSILPVDIEVERSANARAQIAVAAHEASRGGDLSSDRLSGGGRLVGLRDYRH